MITSLLTAFGAVAGIMFAVWLTTMLVIHLTFPKPDSDIHTTHHNTQWGYYFHDPYGSMQSRGGFHTEAGALRAAKKHRDTVARDLQKAMGL